ncbi:MAG: DUF3105 domain-containing protein [Actinomycetota bacterium]|nr:DUF3105 domain-containing protein [Actinomycetota bacterium]MDQ3575133.1 DUF3105 domain-containing protein [Actinomycetota bacterium]
MAKKGKKKRPRGTRSPAANQAGKRAAATSTTAKPPSSSGRARGSASQVSKSQRSKSQAGRSQPSRSQRLEAARRARRRKSLLVRLAIGGIAVALVAGVAVRVLAGRSQEEQTRRQLTAGSCTLDSRADPTDPAPNNHVPNPTYQVDPPAGGNHAPQAARSAIYTQGQVPPDGQLVHAMEHGYVIFWHRPDLSQKDREALLEVAGRHRVDVLVVPRPSLPTTVAATAWERRLLCGAVEPDALDLFTRSYRNRGPEKVPHE